MSRPQRPFPPGRAARGLALALMAAGLMTAPHAQAQILKNGSFETGDFSDWTVLGPTDNAGVAVGAVDLGSPTDGTHLAYFGAMSDTTTLQQDLGDLFGDFSLSFDLSGHTSGGFVGGAVDSGIDEFSTICCVVTPEGQNHYQFFFTGEGDTVVRFNFMTSQDGEFATLDNVVVERAGGAVPEPAAWALMLIGFGLAGAGLRRARRLSEAGQGRAPEPGPVQASGSLTGGSATRAPLRST